MVFEFAGQGRNSSSIALALNERGCERRNGKPWTQRQVAAILSRSRFCREGTLRYGEACGQNKSLGLLEQPE